MKKLLALLMVVIMTASLFTVPAFAAGEYLYDADMEGVAYTESAGRWILDSTDGVDDPGQPAIYDVPFGSAAYYSVGYYKKSVLYKMKLPEIPVGKNLKFAEFRMTSYYPNGGARAMEYAYVLPGNNWEASGLTIGEAKEIIKSTAQSSSGTPLGDYYYGPVTAGGTEYKNDYYYRNKVDVTSFINQCLAENQPYAYIAVTRDNNIQIAYDENTYPARLYYTLEDVSALTAESCTIEDGATGVYPIGKASVTFSNTVKSATATINGAEVPQSDITVSGNSVSVAFNLGLSAATELTVNATDSFSQTASHTISFTTDSRYKFYDDSDMSDVRYTIAEDSWILTYDASASDTSVLAATDVVWNDTDVVGSSKYAVVYKVKLPELPDGKTIDTAEFRATSHYTAATPREMQYAYKMPGQDWNMDTITIADAQKIINGNNLGSGNNYIGSCTKDVSYVYDKDYRNKYSVSEYVAECIANGQEYMYIAATRPSSMVRAYAHDESTSRRKPKLFYTLKDVPVVKGAKLVSADSNVSYADAADIVPSAGQEIKAICYLMNKTNSDVALNIGVAQYSDGELVGLNFGGYTLLAGTDASTVDFGASTVQKGVDEIKVFMWDADNDPVVVSKTINVK